jgi:ribosome recycling factor
MDLAKKMKKDGELTEDDLKTAEKSIQDLTDKYIKNIETITSKKEKEIMEI